MQMKKIEDKILKQQEDVEIKEEKKKTVVEVKDPEVDFIRVGLSPIEAEHPKLAKHYKDLNDAITRQNMLGNRSNEFRRECMQEVEDIRKKIRDYKRNEGITREDEIRWLNG